MATLLTVEVLPHSLLALWADVHTAWHTQVFRSSATVLTTKDATVLTTEDARALPVTYGLLNFVHR